MRLSAPIYRLRHKAKLLARKAGIPLNQALDRVAKDEGFQSWSLLVARNPAQGAAANNHARKSQITALPLAKSGRAEFVETANQVFEAVLNQIEAASCNRCCHAATALKRSPSLSFAQRSKKSRRHERRRRPSYPGCVPILGAKAPA